MKNQEPTTRRMGRVVPIMMLLYLVLGLSYQVATALSGSEGFSFRIAIFIPFILMFAAGSMGIWKQSGWGYILGGASSTAFVLLGLPFNIPIFLNPADPLFLAVWTGNVALIIAALYIVVDYGRLRLRPMAA